MRIGFLYFYHEYHVYHSAPIAFELSRLESDLEVLLLSSSSPSTNAIEQLSQYYPGHRCVTEELSQPWEFRYMNVERRRFPRPRRTIDRHADLLRDLDAVVSTTNGMARLLRAANLTDLKTIMAFHGAGDRAYGFQQRLADFDLLLLSGPKKQRRLEEAAILTRDNWAIIGYPKFDLVKANEKQGFELFQEQRPIVLYNPHFRPHLSSWYSWGREILDYFTHSTTYNLIFAPHVELKGRKQQCLRLGKYRKYPNIHIDLGSSHSYTMAYPNIADVYLGDVSSQVGEFLIRPRPCVFLNAHQVDWERDPSYAHWQLGPVLDDPSQVENGLARAIETHDDYQDKQIRYFKDSYDLTNEPAGLRAARVIASFLEK